MDGRTDGMDERTGRTDKCPNKIANANGEAKEGKFDKKVVKIKNKHEPILETKI